MNEDKIEKEIWKERAFRFATALFEMMDGINDKDICNHTGFDEENCERIAKARSDAYTLIYKTGIIE